MFIPPVERKRPGKYTLSSILGTACCFSLYHSSIHIYVLTEGGRERQKKGAKGFLNCGEDLSGGQDEAVLRFPFVHEVAVDQHG